MSDFVPAFGRWDEPEQTATFFAGQPQIRMAAANIFAADDDADVDLCKLYESATGRKWNSLNQNPRGFCVGFGNGKMASLELAMMAHAGEITHPGPDVAIEPIYGGMRFEIGAKEHGSDLNRGGDGGVGSWACEWLLKYGILLKQPYGSIDLTQYSESRCDKYGRSGVPDELEPVAKEHPLKTASLIEDEQQAWMMIGQLRPLVHCSNQGFSMRRNSDGTCDANDTWPHCAGFTGRFTLPNGTKTLRYDNSWGGYLGSAITVQGKNGPIELNGDQFLVPLNIVRRIITSGRETYSFAGINGYTKRRELFLN